MKKIILSILAIITIFITVGCGNTNNINNTNTIDDNDMVVINNEKFKLKSKTNLDDLEYYENYVDFHSDRIGNIATLTYRKQDIFYFEIDIVSYNNKTLSEIKTVVENQTKTKDKSKVINGINYVYYDYINNDGVLVHHYLYNHKGITYSIGFYLGNNPGNIEEVFMKKVSFK